MHECISESILAGAETAGALRLRKRGKVECKQPWFDQECQQRKSRYKAECRKAKGDTTVKREAYKEYKKFLNRKKETHNDKFNRKLLEKANDPRQFWKLLKNRKNKGDRVNVDLESMHEHFKKLNDAKCMNDGPTRQENSESNEFINQRFTVDGIRKLLNKIKEGKAAGADGIHPEFLKHIPEEMHGVLVNLFNLILETGVVPDEFGKSIICPIYKKRK